MAYGVFVITTILCCLQAVNAASTKNDYVPIKYRGVSNRYGTVEEELPDDCINKGFCTVKPKDYPQEQFNAMFKGTELAPQPSLVVDTFGYRAGDADATDNCETIIEYEPLYKVRSTHGQWHTVIQAPEKNYVQKVRLETCKEIDGACFQGALPATSVVTFCKQKYSVWEFLVSDGNNGTETIKVELPVCCSCQYKINTGK